MRKRAILPVVMGLAVVACSDLGASGLLDRRTVPGGAVSPTTASGLVLDERGLPATSVRIRAFPAVPDVASLIANSSAGLIANSSAGLVSNSAAGLTSSSARFGLPGFAIPPSRRIQAEGIDLVTDQDGRFPLGGLLASGSWNIEAIRNADSKAIAQNVPSSRQTLSLTLAPTGGIQGKVSSDVPQVTDLLGVTVFVPGTGYAALTDASGSFQISSVPVGTFDLVAIHPDLGRGFIQGVIVQSSRITAARPLEIHTVVPDVRKLSANVVAPGQNLTIEGTDFGVSRGKRPTVTLGGVVCQVLEQSDERLVIRIPDTDRSGDVVVRVGELSSVPAPVQVAARLELGGIEGLPAPLSATSDILASGVTRSYEARVLDRTGSRLSGAQVAWSVPGQVASVVAGRLTGKVPGQAVLTASLGSLKASLEVQVIPSIEKLVLQPDPVPELESVPIGEFPLHPERQSIRIEALTTLLGEAGPRALPVRWDTPDGQLVQIDQSGLVTVQPGAAAGFAVIRAVSVADPSKQATLTIPVVRVADWIIEFE